ncbi:MAG: hypothetical protein Q8S84_05475 [bacterium]|nr:hypothetical protein [bacterium]MDP3380941.1 hypothetical protein [bacterium]
MLYVYGSLFLAVTIVFSSHIILLAVEFLLHVNNFAFIHFSIAFLAKTIACFSPDADKITNQSTSLFILSSKLVSSQNIASIHQNIIFAVTIAFPEPAINGLLKSEISNLFISVISNNSNAHITISSSDNKLSSEKSLIVFK